MFNDIITYPIEHEKLRWQAKEVVKDLAPGPYLFIRVTLTGTHFPQLAQIPVVKIGNVRSHHVIITNDRLTVHAYFNHQPPATGAIEFGFGDVMLLRFREPFTLSKVPKLDPKRLPKNIQLLVKPKTD